MKIQTWIQTSSKVGENPDVSFMVRLIYNEWKLKGSFSCIYVYLELEDLLVG